MTAKEHDGSLFNLEQLKHLGGYRAGNLLAVDPDIYGKFMEHLSRTVKRDIVSKNMVFLTALSAFTREPINLFLRGESSIGKTYIIIETVKYFPKDKVWLLGGLSPTALVHDKGKLIDEHGEEIKLDKKPEKPNKTDYQDLRDYRQALQDFKEEKKAWIQKLKTSRYLVDLTGKTLVFLEAPHIMTFNRLRPILSHDTHQISFKVTEKTAKGKLQTIHTVIQGFPATMFCSTDEKYVKDLATRSFTVSPETNPEKYHDANVLTGSKAALPWKFESDFDRSQLESYIRFVKDYAAELTIVIPYAKEFAEQFPRRFPRSMRDFKHILHLIRASVLFHWCQRPIIIEHHKDREQLHIMATRQDFDFVMGLWNEIRETTETSAPGHIIKFFNEIVKPLSQNMATIYIEDLTNEWNDKFEDKRSSDVIRKWVDFLSKIGYVTKNPDKMDKRRNLITVIKEEKNGNYTQIDFSEIFRLDSLKAWLNELKQILRKNRVTIKENFVSDGEISCEAVFKKYFLNSSDEIRNIELSPSQAPSQESTVKITEKRKSVQFPDFKKLERIGPGFNDRCTLCGFEGQMDYQITLLDDTRGFVCEKCGHELEKRFNSA